MILAGGQTRACSEANEMSPDSLADYYDPGAEEACELEFIKSTYGTTQEELLDSVIELRSDLQREQQKTLLAEREIERWKRRCQELMESMDSALRRARSNN